MEYLQEKPLRLLGYYNEPGQKLNPEEEEPDSANELGALLDITFSKIVDVNNDEAFSNALENGVFVMRDKQSHLYGYWPKEKIARVTGVVFNRQFLTLLPLEYKSWFIPGKELTIIEKGNNKSFINPGTTFLDYLRNADNINRISLTADYLPNKVLEGEISSVGKDFFTIRDSNMRTFVLTNHLCLQIETESSVQKGKIINLEDMEDTIVPANGRIMKYPKDNKLGVLENFYGVRFTFKKEDLLDDSKLGDSVTFTSSSFLNKKKGNTQYIALAVHKPKSIKEILQLAESNLGKMNLKSLANQILDIDPDNDSALELLDNLRHAHKATEPTEDTAKYRQAVNLLDEGKYQEAIDKFLELINANVHLKDSVVRVAGAYYALYTHEEDLEEKDIYKNQLLELLKKSHDLISVNQSVNLRLQYYYKLGIDNEYIKIIDSVLQDSLTDNNRRAKMLYYKALKYSQMNGHESEVKSLMEESLFLNPFFNKAELIEYVNEKDAQPSSPLGQSELMNLLLQKSSSGIDKDDTLYKVFHMNASDERYANVLYAAAIVDKSNTPYDNRTTSFIAQYISILAQQLAKKNDTMVSALYTWSNFFRLVPGFGYYVQWNLASLLHSLLHVSIDTKTRIEGQKPWENRKTWKEILDSVDNINASQWNSLLYAISTNQAVIEHLSEYLISHSLLSSFDSYATTIIGHHDEWKKESISQAINNINKIQLHNSAIWKTAKSVAQTLDSVKNLADRYTALQTIFAKQFSTLPLSINDKEISSIFAQQCMPLLSSYLSAPNPDEREETASMLKKQLDNLLDKISSTPSQFGMDVMRPIADALNNDIGNIQHIMSFGDRSELNLAVTSDNIKPDDDGKYTVNFNLTNTIDSLTATDIRLELRSKYMEEEEGKEENYHLVLPLLAAGSNQVFSFRVALRRDEIADRASWTFAIICYYKTNGVEYQKIFSPLQVHLYQEEPFIPITTNPFTIAPALQENDPTYVAREEYMTEILNAVLHPQRAGAQIIVYGQKRCGKSTLMEAVQNKLNKDYTNSAWCVYTTLRIESRDRFGKKSIYSEGSFYRFILHGIKQQLINYEEPKPTIDLPSAKDFEEADSPTQLFSDCIVNFKNSMKNTAGWENRRLVLIIDEFTVLYNSIKAGVADEQILHHWKGIQESPLTNFATIFVGHDITPTFFNEPYASNATKIIDRMLVTYLKREEAYDLIQRPIMAKGKSRFEIKALDRIFRYTAGNPYYLQMFMKRMVDYINNNKIVLVTDIDVQKVAEELITKKYEDLCDIHSFDSLINSGLEDRFCDIKDKQFEIVLRAIAIASKGLLWCTMDGLRRELRKDKVDSQSDLEIINKRLDFILQDLYDRKVIDRRDNNQQLKIIVGLFKEWLIRN